MSGIRAALEKVKIEDSEGKCFFIGKCTRRNGEVITCPSGFTSIDYILENLEQLDLADDSIMLVSYSKSGTHWIYEILDMLIKGKACPAEQFKMTDFLEDRCIDDFTELKSFKILNTHLKAKYLPSKLILKHKIIHMARNPKSVAVSFFFHTLNRKRNCYEGTFHGYLPIFLEGYFSVYGNWFEYIKDWWDLAKTHPNIYTLFYEDLKKNPEEEIAKLSIFLGYDHNPEFISQVAAMSSFEVMKEGMGKSEEVMRNAKEAWKHNQHGMLRTGSIQDWKNYFTVSQNEMFDRIYDKEMEDYLDLKSLIKFE